MSLDGNQKVLRATTFLVAQLNILNKLTNGLTDAKIAAITSTGTVAKLKTAIAALTLRTQDKHYQDHVIASIDRCKLYGTLTDADVETARAAGNPGAFAALKTAIVAHSQASSIDTKAQAHAIWAN
jgi:hypothetical protein